MIHLFVVKRISFCRFHMAIQRGTFTLISPHSLHFLVLSYQKNCNHTHYNSRRFRNFFILFYFAIKYFGPLESVPLPPTPTPTPGAASPKSNSLVRSTFGLDSHKLHHQRKRHSRSIITLNHHYCRCPWGLSQSVTISLQLSINGILFLNFDISSPFNAWISFSIFRTNIGKDNQHHVVDSPTRN
jgi:hypothetical protein